MDDEEQATYRLVCRVLDPATCPPLGTGLHDLTRRAPTFMLLADVVDTRQWLASGVVPAHWRRELETWRLLPRPHDRDAWLAESPPTNYEAVWLIAEDDDYGGDDIKEGYPLSWFAVRRIVSPALPTTPTYVLFGASRAVQDSRVIKRVQALLGPRVPIHMGKWFPGSTEEARHDPCVPLPAPERWRIARSLLPYTTSGRGGLVRMFLDYLEMLMAPAGLAKDYGKWSELHTATVVAGEIARLLFFAVTRPGDEDAAAAAHRIFFVHPDRVRFSDKDGDAQALRQVGDDLRTATAGFEGRPILLLMPICTGGHWTLLVGHVSPEERRYWHCDSFASGFAGHWSLATRVVANFELLRPATVVAEGYLVAHNVAISEQQLQTECGVYVLAAVNAWINEWTRESGAPQLPVAPVTQRAVQQYQTAALDAFWAYMRDAQHSAEHLAALDDLVLHGSKRLLLDEPALSPPLPAPPRS